MSNNSPRPQPRPATIPVISPGVAALLQVPYPDLSDALRREGWAGRTLTAAQATAWAENPGLAPTEVGELITRQQIRRLISGTMAPQVGSILKVNPLGVANRARRARHLAFIDTETAQAWIRNRHEAPAWVQEMLNVRDQRSLAAARRKAEAMSAMDQERRADTERRITEGWLLRDKHLPHVEEILGEARAALNGPQGAAGLTEAGAILLARDAA